MCGRYLKDEGGVGGVVEPHHLAVDGEGGGALVGDFTVLDIQLRLLCKDQHF